MATRPANTFHWADVGGNVLAPLTARQNVGYVPGEMPPAPEANYLFKTLGEWLAFLNASTVDFGTATLQSDNLTVDTAATVNALTVTSLKHGDRVKTMSALLVTFDASLDNWQPATGGSIMGIYAVGDGFAYLAPTFDQGDRVKSITVARSGDGVADLVITVYEVAANGTRTSIGTATVSNPNATVTDTTIDLTDTTIGTGNSIVVSFEAQNNINAITLYNARFTYDRP